MYKNSRLLHSDGRVHAVRRKFCQGCTVSGEILRVARGRRDRVSQCNWKRWKIVAKRMDFRKRLPSSKHCGSSRSVLRDELACGHHPRRVTVLNGLMYFLGWHKPLDVRCPIQFEFVSCQWTSPTSAKKNYHGEFY